jgi:hypothetical protein
VFRGELCPNFLDRGQNGHQFPENAAHVSGVTEKNFGWVLTERLSSQAVKCDRSSTWRVGEALKGGCIGLWTPPVLQVSHGGKQVILKALDALSQAVHDQFRLGKILKPIVPERLAHPEKEDFVEGCVF